MTSTTNQASLADKGQAIALRLLERKVVPSYPKRHGNIPL